jgi:hypothetical protein
MKTQISVGNELFKNERNNYANWPSSFWRELTQNSMDARASRLEINVFKPGEKLRPDNLPISGLLVEFNDNGHGMTADVLLNVFFRLGETTKKSTDYIGGNGKARMITCFSQHAYGIDTQKNHVVGYGSDVDLTEVETWTYGCKFWIDVDIQGRYNQQVDMIYWLKDFLSLAQLSCDIVSNLPEVNGFKDWLYKRRHARTFTFGNAYANKSGEKKGSTVVRVNGLPMFVKFHGGNTQVVVELDYTKSREILVSNRDSLSSVYERELDAFLQELTVDTKSALRDKRVKEERFIGLENSRSISYRANRKQKEVVVEAPIAEGLASAAKMATQHAYRYPTGAVPTGMAFVENLREEIVDRRFSKNVPTFSLFVDTDNAVMKKAMWLYNPENSDGKYFGTTKKKLAVLWSIAVEEAISDFLEITQEDFLAWMPGFLFSTEAEGFHKKENSTHYAYVCPVDLKGNMKFKLNNRNDRNRLLLVAAHEVAHFRYDYHNEDFSQLAEEIYYRMVNRLNRIMKRMSAVLKDFSKAHAVVA